MKFIIKSVVALVGLIIVTGGAAFVAIFGLGSFLMLKYAKSADGLTQNSQHGKTGKREPLEYEPMTLEEIRAL